MEIAKKILFRIPKYSLTLVLLSMSAFLLYVNFNDYETSVAQVSELTGIPFDQVEWYHPYNRGIYFLSLLYHNTYGFFVELSLSSAIIGTLLLYRGRSLNESLSLFMFLIIPRQRKTWGVVFDAHDNKPVPLTILKLYKHTPDNKVIAAQAVSDFEGRYKLYFHDRSAKHSINALAKGYTEAERHLDLNQHTIESGEIKEDIPLNRADKSSSIRTLIFKFRSKFYENLLLFLYVFSILSFLREFYGVFIFPGFSTYFLASAYGFSVVWNTIIMRERIKAENGRIINAGTKLPLQSIPIKVVDKRFNVQTYISDAEGLIKTRLPKGNYQGTIDLPGYTINGADNRNYINITINSRGFLEDNISVKVDKEYLEANPFA